MVSSGTTLATAPGMQRQALRAREAIRSNRGTDQNAEVTVEVNSMRGRLDSMNPVLKTRANCVEPIPTITGGL